MDNILPENLTLHVSGFNIRVNFHPTDQIFYKELIKKEIVENMAGFTVKTAIKPDFVVNFRESDSVETVYKKRKHAFYLQSFVIKDKNEAEIYYQAGFLQFCLLLRLIVQKLLDKTGFLMHASAVRKGKDAYVFTGHSGAGKSTIMKMLDKKYPALADDSVIIKKEDNKYYLYQTPTIEKEWWVKKSRQKYQIKAVFFLKKSQKFEITGLNNKADVLPRLTDQLFLNDKRDRNKIKTLVRFVREFDNFELLSFAKNGKITL